MQFSIYMLIKDCNNVHLKLYMYIKLQFLNRIISSLVLKFIQSKLVVERVVPRRRETLRDFKHDNQEPSGNSSKRKNWHMIVESFDTYFIHDRIF
jgi:hypothetical protein